MGPLYQSANRLAYTFWLREEAMIDTWLVHLVFDNDPTLSEDDQTDAATWRIRLKQVETDLGVDDDVPWHASVILPGR